MAVSLPFVLLLLDYGIFKRLQFRFNEFILEKFPFFIALVLSVFMEISTQYHNGAMSNLYRLPFSYRIINALHSVAFYIEKSIVPVNLAALYPFMIRNFFPSNIFVRPYWCLFFFPLYCFKEENTHISNFHFYIF